MRFDPARFVFVRPHTIEICPVRAGEKITRLEEVHMSIDVTRKDEFPGAIDPLRTDRHSGFFAAGNALDLLAVDYENDVLDDLAVCGVNHRTADQGNLLS